MFEAKEMKEAKNRERTKEREWEKERNTTKYSCPLTSLGLVRAVFKIVPFIRWGGIPCSGVTIPFCFSAWPFTCPFFGFFLCFLYLTLQNTTDTKKMATLWWWEEYGLFIYILYWYCLSYFSLQSDHFPSQNCVCISPLDA